MDVSDSGPGQITPIAHNAPAPYYHEHPSTYPRDARDPREERDARDYHDPRDFARDQRDYRDPRGIAEPEPASTMATALISPDTPHYPHNMYQNGNYHHAPSHDQGQATHQGHSHSHSLGHSIPPHPSSARPSPPTAAGSMISPTESRRESNDTEINGGGPKPSLPSIQSIVGANTSAPAPAPSYPSNGPLPHHYSAQPPPPPPPPAQRYPNEAPPEHSSPHPAQHTSPAMYGPRPGPYGEASRPLPPPGGQPPPPPPPPTGPPHHMQHHAPHAPHPSQHAPPPPQRPTPEGMPQPPRYGHPSPPTVHRDYPPPSMISPPPPRNAYPVYDGAIPQHPLPPPMSAHGPPPPGYPVAPPPGYAGPPPPPGRYEHGPMMQPDPAEYDRRRDGANGVGRQSFATWNYAEYFQRIGTNARTILNFAEAFSVIAREEHGARPLPARMPEDREVMDMIHNTEWLKVMLEDLRGVIHRQNAEQAVGPHHGRRGHYDEGDGMMGYDSDPKPYGEVKKRRGRAAPPGRCHSCNRVDTPEWRRGPDGARTLCNACGLHYAKLERKKQIESRNPRPRQMPDEKRH